jgi:hypothetical protein
MTDDSAEKTIEEYVRLKFLPFMNGVFDEARREVGGELGTLASSAIVAMERAERTWDAALRKVYRARISIEVEARQRFGLRLSSRDGDRILQAIEEIVRRACGENGAVGGVRRRTSSADHRRSRRERLRDHLISEARQAVELAVVGAAMPAAKRDDVTFISVNAPNFGVIAARIGELNFVGAGAVKDDLAKLASVAETIRDEDLREAGELLVGLLVEAERIATSNLALVRAGLRRLGELAPAGDVDGTRELIDRLDRSFESACRPVKGAT